MTYKINSVYTLDATQFYFTAENKNLASLTIINNKVVTTLGNRYACTIDGVVCVSPDTIKSVVKAITKHVNNLQAIDQNPRAGKEDKKNPVEVVRFLRPYSFNENMFGVTFIFTLNYHTRRIDVKISVCNGDNFSRQEGIDRAKNGKISMNNLYMPDDIYNSNGKDGLVKWLIERVPNETCGDKNAKFNINQTTLKLIIDMYSNSRYNDELRHLIESGQIVVNPR